MKISVIIPVFNEKDLVQDSIGEVIKSLRELKYDFEIIIVDDGSKDGTKEVLYKAKELNQSIVLVDYKENRGKGHALRLGLKRVSGDIVIFQDADLEYNPKNYSTLITPIISENYDVVYGSRFFSGVTSGCSYTHYLKNKAITTLSNSLSGLSLTDMETCYKVFKTEIIMGLDLVSEHFDIEPEITMKISKIEKLRLKEVEIDYKERSINEGKKLKLKDAIEGVLALIKHS